MSNFSALAIPLLNLEESRICYRGLNVDPFPGLLDDLDDLIGIIRGVSGRQSEIELTKELENDIRGLVFEFEDAIERYIVLASTEKHRGFFARTVGAQNYSSKLHSLGDQISESREKLKNIKRRADVQRIASEDSKVDEISYMRARKQTPLVAEDYVVGFEHSAKDVIELLIGESQGQSDQLEVISIIGMPGLGKTTLARKVLHDPIIEYDFVIRVFVYVSQEYNRKEVFLRILDSVTDIDGATSEMRDSALAQLVEQHLKYKYLIVLDDVWTTDTWEILKSAFPNNNNGSRVLITSRNADVAHRANPKIRPYHLQFLLREAARELLRIKVFGEDKCPEKLLRYESKILDKCDDLPLAIVVVAGILRMYGESSDGWSKVSDNMNDYVAKDEKLNSDVIRRSYDQLPYNLKPCFLYIGVFPESFEIPVWKLLRLWIAEGFIQQQEFETIEDTAEEYLTELVSRSLVMIGQKSSYGQIKTCRLNDMLRNFCKAEATKEYLFQEIKCFDEGTSSSSSFSHKERRLCVNSHVKEFITRAKPTVEHVRSFLSFAKGETVLAQNHISSILKAFELLRVLDVSSINFSHFPLELFYLFLLKFIAISSSFKVLPEKMSNLENLQTIIVETSSRTLEIKADIWKMAQLRHLYTNCSTSIPKGEEGSSINVNLQTLSTISPESCRRELFDKTPMLKKLGIRGSLGSRIEEIFDSLVKLNFLEDLKLLNDGSTSKLYSLPPPFKFPRNLSRLTLLNTLLDWSHMSILGKLENLEVLKLKDNAFEGQFWETEEGGYRRLRVLHIGSTNLVHWKATASCFPTLESLAIRDCKMLKAIPSDLGDISSLQLIDLCRTNASVASSARKIQVLKLRVQAQQGGPKGSTLKLSVYPPEQ